MSHCYAANFPSFFNIQDTYYEPHTQWDESHVQLFRAFLAAFKEVGGNHFLRLFAMSDFKKEHHAFWVHVCELAREAGVPPVVFTKTRACVEALAVHVTRMVISRDNSARWDFGSPAWVADDTVIAEYKLRYPSVVTSAMVVDERDIEEVEADFYIAHHGKYSHLNFDRRITQERVIEIVGKKRGCTPAHRCVGCPTACMVHQKRAVEVGLSMAA